MTPRALAVAAVLASATLTYPPAPPPHDVGDRLVRECPGATMDTPRCKDLAAQVELLAIRELAFMNAAEAPMDKAFLREAAASPNGALRGLALTGMALAGLDKGDEPLIVDALSSEFPGVRAAAFELVPRLSDAKYAKWQKRSYERTTNDHYRPPLAFVGQRMPSEKAIGAAAYPGASYVWFASGPKRAFFLTGDAPPKVIAFYANGGKRVRTLAELEAIKNQPPPQIDPMEMMRRMRAGEDPKKMIADLQANAGSASMTGQWIAGIKGEEGIVDPRFVEVATLASTPQGVTPARVVIVFRDEILGGTGIVIPRTAAARSLIKTGTGDDVQESIWVRQALSR
jgi:hypothetical protein